MGEALAAGSDLETVLNHVTEEVAALVHADAVRLLLLGASQQLRVAASWGLDAQTLIDKAMPATAGIAGEVLSNGRPVRARTRADIDRADQIIEGLDGANDHSLIAAPLHLGSLQIGVLEAAHPAPHFFSAEDLDLLETVATWTSVAVGTSRQHEALQRRHQERETLAALSQALNEAADLEHILQLTVDAARRVIPGVGSAVIHLLNPEGTELQPVATSGLENLARQSVRMQVGEGVAGLVMASGLPVNVPDVSLDQRYLAPADRRTACALLCAPVRSGQLSLGTISVQSASVGAFGEDEEKLLCQLGVVAALAIENARLFEIERRRLQEAEAMQRVTQAMISQSTPGALVEEFATAMARHTPYQTLSLYLMNDGKLSLTTRQGYPEDRPPPVEVAASHPFLSRVLETATPALATGIAILPGYAPAQARPISAAAVPLHPRPLPSPHGKTEGVLLVEARSGRTLDHNDLRWLSAVAMQLGAALDRTHVYRALADALQEEQSTREQLVQAGKLAAMGRMVASVAHELNNPLQTIRNCLFLVREEIEGYPESEGYLDMALNEIDRLARLVQQLREVYRPESSARLQRIDLCRLLEETRQVTSPHLERNRVRWVSLPASGPVWVLGSADQLKQVFLNLCLNAVDAMQPEGGTITLRMDVGHSPGRVAVVLEDTGHAIDPDHLPLLFDPFFTTKETGMGLGLPISYDIVRRHDGEIEVQSQAGQGTSFTVWLPLAGAERKQGPGARELM